MDRRGILAIVAVVAVLAGVVGWLAGQRVKSEAELAAEREPPPPSLITVPIELQELSQNVVVRGTVRASNATELTVASASGESIITRLPKDAGDVVAEGDVLIEVAGRPVIALQGDLPVFRNLIPSLEGPDVRQLEEALLRLGYDPGTVDDVYDSSTAAAVEELYRAAGYSPGGEDDTARTAASAARDAVDAQNEAVSQARDALTQAQDGMSTSERLQLDQSLQQAREGVDQAKVGRHDANAEATATLDATYQPETDAWNRLQTAQGGTNPDTGQPPTAEELAQFQAEFDQAKAARVAAETAKARTAEEQDRLVRDAETNLAITQASFDEQTQPADTADLQRQVDDANEALSDAREELADAESRVGARIPANEIVFLPDLAVVERQVQRVNVEVGDFPQGPAMTISGVDVLIESGLASADRRLVSVGDVATLEDEPLGLEIEAIVSFVADSPGGPDLSADRYALRLEPMGDVPDDALNVNLRISIPVSSSGGEVLAVPFAALSAGANGAARVEVERTPGDVEVVEVVTGLRANGLVQIDPVDADLAEGDRVVVGRDLVLPGSDTADGTPDGTADTDTDTDTDTDDDDSESIETESGDG
ncbi:MAG: peptidoglycan-binding protein [Actinomycetota bacterium]